MNHSRGNFMFRKTVLAGMFAAAGVVLSVISIPMGPTKCFPFQHAINVMAGITLGPLWALGAAFITSLIRNMMGTGSLFAFPGSMFGALCRYCCQILERKIQACGRFSRACRHRHYRRLGELNYCGAIHR